jgi:hypothetical protein
MAQCITIEPGKTYATAENARRAVDKKVTNPALANLRYMIVQHTDGRFYPLFIGMQAAEAGMHWHFNVVA